MELALSTATLHPTTPDALQRAAGLGATHMEFNLQGEEFGYGYRWRPNTPFYRQVRQQLDALRLRAWSVTLPPLTQQQMFSGRARQEILLAAVSAAGILGAQVLVLRPADIFTSEDAFEQYLRDNLAPPVIAGFDEAWAQAANQRLTLALRNENYGVGTLLTNEAGRLHKVTADLAIGWALDVRRAVQRSDLPLWLEANAERLAVAYLYDLENGRFEPPRSEAWHPWLPLLNATRLKCAVIDAPPGSSDDELADSLAYLRRLLAPAA